MKCIVLDTNVLVSGFLSPYGSPGRIVDWVRQRAIQLILDDRISCEYFEVLKRPEYGFPIEDVDYILNFILSFARRVDVPPDLIFNNLPDPDDAPFAECASLAQCPLITGNKRHYPTNLTKGIVILSPSEFVQSLSSD